MPKDRNHLPKCSYGCGKEAKKLFKNGKWCCSEHAQQCSVIKHRISNGLKSTLSKKNKYTRRTKDGGTIKIVAARNIYNSGFFGTKPKPKKVARKTTIDRLTIQQPENQYA